jgi:hypothetical protein
MLFRYFFKTEPHLSGYFSFYAILEKKIRIFCRKAPWFADGRTGCYFRYFSNLIKKLYKIRSDLFMTWSLILASQNSRWPFLCFFGGKSDRSKNLSVTVRDSLVLAVGRKAFTSHFCTLQCYLFSTIQARFEIRPNLIDPWVS